MRANESPTATNIPRPRSIIPSHSARPACSMMLSIETSWSGCRIFGSRGGGGRHSLAGPFRDPGPPTGKPVAQLLVGEFIVFFDFFDFISIKAAVVPLLAAHFEKCAFGTEILVRPEM